MAAIDGRYVIVLSPHLKRVRLVESFDDLDEAKRRLQELRQQRTGAPQGDYYMIDKQGELNA